MMRGGGKGEEGEGEEGGGEEGRGGREGEEKEHLCLSAACPNA